MDQQWNVVFTEDAAHDRNQLDSDHLAALTRIITTLRKNPTPHNSHPITGLDGIRQLVDFDGLCITYVVVHGMLMIIVVQVWTPRPLPIDEYKVRPPDGE